MKVLLYCGSLSQVTTAALQTVGASEVILVTTLDGARKELASHASELVGIVVDGVSIKINDAKRFVNEAHRKADFVGFIVASAIKANYMDQLCENGADSADTDRRVTTLAQEKISEFQRLISAHDNNWDGLYKTICSRRNHKNGRQSVIRNLLSEATPAIREPAFF